MEKFYQLFDEENKGAITFADGPTQLIFDEEHKNWTPTINLLDYFLLDHEEKEKQKENCKELTIEEFREIIISKGCSPESLIESAKNIRARDIQEHEATVQRMKELVKKHPLPTGKPIVEAVNSLMESGLFDKLIQDSESK